MIVKRINLCALDTGSLTLGYVGENDHTQIRINCASVFADYPSAVVSMTVKAPSGVVYPREVETDGQIVIWTITDSDTASAGNGQIQLTFTEDGTIVKTVIAVTTVRASLVGDNPPPDPITDWIDEAGEALAKLEGITASATQLPAGEDPTAEVEVVDGHYNIALGIPGADAESIIDDNAGVGDVTKVWSANKSATELSELKSAIDRKAPCIYQDASGDIVSFADGADGMPLSSCVVQIDPVQDLHGENNPYPAGGGKNLLPLMVDKIKSANTAGTWNGNAYTLNGLTFTINVDASGNVSGINVNGTASANTVFDFFPSNSPLNYTGTYILNGCPSGGSTSTYRLYAICNVSGSSSYPSDTGSGSSAFTLAADDYISYTRIEIKSGTAVSNIAYKPMIRISTADGTFAPYSNICPITGWTGADVYRTGKNLIDDSKKAISYSDVFIGTTEPLVINMVSTFLKAGTYTLSVETSDGTDTNLYAGYARQGTAFAQAYSTKKLTFTLSKDSGVRLWAYKSGYDQIGTSAITSAMLNEGSTPQTYTPYVGTTYPISWQTAAGTVYGGTVDTRTGVLTVTQKKAVFSENENWQLSGSSFFYAQLSGDGHESASHLTENGVKLYWYGDSNQVRVYLSNNPFLTTSSNMHDYLDGIGFLYELATPLTYQLDPVQMTTLFGQNHIWSDTGAVALTYPADTKLYIQQLTKPTEDDMTANTAITSGKFFMVGNRLFLATAAIAVGATIIPGTNCTELSLADALNNINA